MRIVSSFFLTLPLLLGITSCSSSEAEKSIMFELSVHSFTHKHASAYSKDGQEFHIRFGEFITSQKMRRGRTGGGGIKDIPKRQKFINAMACSLPDAIGFKKINIEKSTKVKESIIIGQAQKANITFPQNPNFTYGIGKLSKPNSEGGRLLIDVELNGSDLPIGAICVIQMFSIIGDRNPDYPIERLAKYFEIIEGDLLLKPYRKGVSIWDRIIKGNNLKKAKVIIMGHSTDETGNIGFYADTHLNFDW